MITHFCACTEKCSDKKSRLQARLDAAEYPLVGLTLPRCDEQGNYAPVQCRGSK